MHSVAKLAAKPKTVDEKLSKGSLFKAIREVEGAMNLHFERILGSRGAAAVFRELDDLEQQLNDEYNRLEDDWDDDDDGMETDSDL